MVSTMYNVLSAKRHKMLWGGGGGTRWGETSSQEIMGVFVKEVAFLLVLGG